MSKDRRADNFWGWAVGIAVVVVVVVIVVTGCYSERGARRDLRGSASSWHHHCRCSRYGSGMAAVTVAVGNGVVWFIGHLWRISGIWQVAAR